MWLLIISKELPALNITKTTHPKYSYVTLYSQFLNLGVFKEKKKNIHTVLIERPLLTEHF